MKSLFRNTRKNAMDKQKIGKYFIYALGEILLIIIGILIAVKINDSVQSKQDSKLRCIYLNELLYTFDYDIKDVNENISAFEKWNPRIYEVLDTLHRKGNLESIDSLYHKLGTAREFIFFGQRSKSKIEELKYSTINLIENRELKNKILLYQDDNIMFLRNIEVRYDQIGEDIRKYYSKHFRGHSAAAKPLNLKALGNDNLYFSLLSQKLGMNNNLMGHYQRLNEVQMDIRKLIIEEIEKKCKD